MKEEDRKSPLGLIPSGIHKQKRALEIIAAMDRYVRANKPIPSEWFDELRDLYEAA